MSDKVLWGFWEVAKFFNHPYLDRLTSSEREMEKKGSFLHWEKISAKSIVMNILFLYKKHCLCS